jgi:lysophospholipase L1-like esterase
MLDARRARLFTLCLLAAALAACAGNATNPIMPRGSNAALAKTARRRAAGVLDRIVGVGDSLTAGMESAALLGQTGVTSWISSLPYGEVPETQQHGYWSLLYEQAKGVGFGSMSDPSVSPLPLIAGPGLGSELVPTWWVVPTPTQSWCSSINEDAYSRSTAGLTRLNASRLPLDLGIPGITTHQALAMTGPTSSCSLLGLAGAAENNFFFPVLESFNVSPLTEMNAAVSLRPTLATVWLGANDLLGFIFSGGSMAGIDTPAQMQADISNMIEQLQHAGARVAVANLPDVLTLAYFETDLNELPLVLQKHRRISPVQASAIAGQIRAAYHLDGRARITLHGMNRILRAIHEHRPLPRLHPPGRLHEADYLSGTFVQQIQELNDQYNAAIAAAATQTAAPLVDIHSAFVQIASNGGYWIDYPVCCTLDYEGGLLSLDGLHPSNTGYAVIANVFIDTIDRGFGLSIPRLSSAQLYNIYESDPLAPH